MSIPVAVVAHTHWDREWYSSFEEYRARLVAMMDELLELLETCPQYRHFHLDGQVALVDDYVGVHPAGRDRIAALVAAGRLAVGPWYVLMDEFCVSGETIVRNLQRGLHAAAGLGGTAFVGYLPDMFGHVDQMPQILQAAGIDHAVVWRGVPAAVDATGFWWQAPDRSRVRAEYLPVGYANGAFLPPDPERLVARVDAHYVETSRFRGASAPLLLLNGGDHHGAQPDLPDLLDAANAAQDAYDFSQITLAGYLDSVGTSDLGTWSGELRSGARANLLMGVLSNRVDVKVAAAQTERQLERLAEPLAALWLPPELWPQEMFDEAWLAVIRNSAHDSICACSSDAVGRAVMARYDSAAAVAATVSADALAIAGVATTAAGPVVVNPSPRARTGVVEIVLPGPPIPGRAGVQILESVDAGRTEASGTGADLARILGELAGDGWLGASGRGTAAEIRQSGETLQLLLGEDASRGADPGMAPIMAEAWARAGAGRHQPLVVTVDRAASHRVAAVVGAVPGYGWTVWSPGTAGCPPVTVDGHRMDNGLISVAVDPDGTFSLDGQPGFGVVVDEGDDGDTYNFSPPVGDERVDTPVSVAVEVLETGPVRARLAVRRTYGWPERLVAGTRTGRITVEVLSTLEIRAGEAFVRVTTSCENRCRDHRVRTVFPLFEVADASVAETAFGTVRRGLDAEGGPHEHPLPTFPSRRFVTAGGLFVTHEGLLEYEVVDGGRALSLTLLRCVGTLSKPAPAWRPNSAGPAVPVEDAQMAGHHTFRYALAAGGDPWRMTDEAWVPLAVVAGTGTGHLPVSGSRLVVSGGEVSALYRRAGRLEMRVFNPADSPVVVDVPGHAGCLVDLVGREITDSRWRGRFELGPHRIATARLDAVTLD